MREWVFDCAGEAGVGEFALRLHVVAQERFAYFGNSHMCVHIGAPAFISHPQ